MRPILFSVGSVNFYSYGFFLAVGFIVGVLVLFWLAKISKQVIDDKDRSEFLDLILYSVLAGLVCGRIGHIIIFASQYRGVPFWEAMLRGGFSFYPGLIAGLLIFILLLHRFHKPVWNWLALGMLGLLAGKAVAHIGGYLSGQAIGLPSPKFLAFGGTTYPIQLYLLIWTIVGLTVLVAAIFKGRVKNLADVAKSKFVFLFGLFWLALGNFLIDFLLAKKSTVWILTLQQWVSLIVVALIILWYILMRKKLLHRAPLDKR